MARIKQVLSRIFSSLIAAIPRPVAKLFRSILFFLKHNFVTATKYSKALPGELTQAKNAILMIGHSNYLESTGGTERIIVSEVEELLRNGINSIFIYPKTSTNRVRLRKPKLYGVILNGYEICDVKSRELNSLVLQLNLAEVRIHHVLQWPLKDIISLIRKLKSSRVSIFLYIHDFLFTCPKVNKFCFSGNNLCQASFYEWTIKLWRNHFEQLFDLASEIKVPSEFMKRQFGDRFSRKVVVFSPHPAVDMPLVLKKKIAYLGYASPIKGYNTWIKLASNALITRAYDLVHLGHRQKSISNVPAIPYSFHSSRECIASNLLTENNVDYVLLWSQVPESFSFTFHEAKKAQKFVLTSKDSGNIAFEINKTKEHGLVLDSEYELFQFLVKNIAERTS